MEQIGGDNTWRFVEEIDSHMVQDISVSEEQHVPDCSPKPTLSSTASPWDAPHVLCGELQSGLKGQPIGNKD